MKFENQILIGDVLEQLALLPDGCIQTCITSPPYWGLRDYGTATWEGGKNECDHIESRKGQSLAKLADQMDPRKKPRNPTRHDDDQIHGRTFKDVCLKCGAQRIDNQIGLEKTPEEFTEKMMDVFREVRRVLRDDGTLWLNLGDSYNAYNHNRGPAAGYNKNHAGIMPTADRGLPVRGLKVKDLIGMPWRVAFTLQDDGWYLRSDIIWSKPNPMPESVTDRPTKAHEYIFLMTKSARYYYDADAIKERVTGNAHSRGDGVNPKAISGWDNGAGDHRDKVGRYPRPRQNPSFSAAISGDVTDFRNRRTVWEIPTQPYPDAHFATFPENVVVPCILAGSKKGDVVLDPFMGSGTVALVALKAGRKFVGVELNPEYAKLAEKRIAQERNQMRLL